MLCERLSSGQRHSPPNLLRALDSRAVFSSGHSLHLQSRFLQQQRSLLLSPVELNDADEEDGGDEEGGDGEGREDKARVFAEGGGVGGAFGDD